MKKKLILVCLVFLAISTAGQVQAQTQKKPAGQSQSGQSLLNFLDETALKGGLTADPKTETDVFGLIARIVNVVLSLIGIVFFALTFYHGFRWMTAGGAEDTIKEAKTGIKQSLIGITIVLSSFVLTNFVLNRLNILNPALAPVDRPNVPVGEGAPAGLDNTGNGTGNPSDGVPLPNPLDTQSGPLPLNPAPDNIPGGTAG